MKIFRDLVQGSDEWLYARLGKLTASNAGALITPTGKKATGKGVKTLASQIAGEIITGRIQPSITTWDMERGHVEEILARELYAEKYEPVEEVGFITENFDGMEVGFSPDGLVGLNKIIEIKSRLPKFQIQTIVSGEVPSEYKAQIQTGLLVSGRGSCDFIQYSNGLPMFVKNMSRDEDYISTLLEAIAELQENIIQLIGSYNANSKELYQTDYVEHANYNTEIEVEND